MPFRVFEFLSLLTSRRRHKFCLTCAKFCWASPSATLRTPDTSAAAQSPPDVRHAKGGVSAKVSWEWKSGVTWLYTPMASSVALPAPGNLRLQSVNRGIPGLQNDSSQNFRVSSVARWLPNAFLLNCNHYCMFQECLSMGTICANVKQSCKWNSFEFESHGRM